MRRGRFGLDRLGLSDMSVDPDCTPVELTMSCTMLVRRVTNMFIALNA